jgi:hypothetical protein
MPPKQFNHELLKLACASPAVPFLSSAVLLKLLQTPKKTFTHFVENPKNRPVFFKITLWLSW